MVAEDSIERFLKIRAEHPDGFAMWHCRISTHGTKTVENCHPFPLGGSPLTYVGHNGILSIPQVKDDPRSDTKVFADELLPALGGVAALDNPLVWAMLEKWSVGSKIVVLTVDPAAKKQIYIINESAGNTDTDGIWWSNAYHRYKRPTQNNYSQDWQHGKWNPDTKKYEDDYYLTHRFNRDMKRYEKIITMFETGQFRPTKCGDKHMVMNYEKADGYCVKCAMTFDDKLEMRVTTEKWWIMTQGPSEDFFTYSPMNDYDLEKDYARTGVAHSFKKGCKTLGRQTPLAFCFTCNYGWDDEYAQARNKKIHAAVNGCNMHNEGTSLARCKTHLLMVDKGGEAITPRAKSKKGQRPLQLVAGIGTKPPPVTPPVIPPEESEEVLDPSLFSMECNNCWAMVDGEVVLEKGKCDQCGACMECEQTEACMCWIPAKK